MPVGPPVGFALGEVDGFADETGLGEALGVADGSALGEAERVVLGMELGEAESSNFGFPVGSALVMHLVKQKESCLVRGWSRN